MENHYILQPLLPITTTNNNGEDTFDVVPPTCRITLRLGFVFLISIISVWANYEASKGFDIIIINDVPGTYYGRKFDLLFVSNGKAIRIVLNTSEFAESVLYPNSIQPKKIIQHVTLKLSIQNVLQPVVVSIREKGHYVISISPSIMEETNVQEAIVSSIQRAMAYAWLWDGEERAPRSLKDGIVEFISMSAGFSSPSSDIDKELHLPLSDGLCWTNKDPFAVAHFLNYCEGLQNGFIGRLNQAMKDSWDARMVDDALGLPAQKLCLPYHSNYYFSRTTKDHKTFPLTMPSYQH
ncbi:hypothetical protein GIB67_027941 [Kingdonia uniflora]|uniref:Uncharacterized protein n=1 Tax=Kingdonia uniflora TaxID=39325 RepID=A0A7J7LGL7_9MAGN|nr:hypothetical protein GIB67_027941 [Kingdonia uniflora]